MEVRIIEKPLDTIECLKSIEDDSVGGHSLFIGTTRNHSKGEKVIKLEFEAYESMAIKVLVQICREAEEKWPVFKTLIHHRVGTVGLGEAAVIVGVSASHRDEAFKACRYIIDELKGRAPIWKKEFLVDGEVWVNAHP